MTNRWTLVSQRMATEQTFRNDDVRRRSGELKYWLLAPVAVLLIYAAFFWAALVALSSISERARRH
ncbi:MAG TPA: hypothetical protein HA364_01060 [Thermoplasmata archaeon]|nr:hypothetical protein [Thermoplasmata archaeon]